MGDRPLLADKLNTAGNALDLVRLGLAITVVLAHSWELTFGHSDGRILPWAGPVAVDCFFAISGFLITRSRLRLSLGRFMLHRVARIMPAFWVCLIFTAFVVAPVMSSIRDVPLNWAESWSYVWRNAGLVIGQFTIGDTLAGMPFEQMWNGSLWTLAYEFWWYLVAAVALASRRGRLAGASFVFVLFTVVCASAGDKVGGLPLMRLGLFFVAGAMLQVGKRSVIDSAWIALMAAAVVVGTFFVGSGAYYMAAPLPLAYLVLWLGAHLPLTGAGTDLSYGVYVFASPLQQLAVGAGVAAHLGPALFAAVSVLMVLPLAWLSWVAVERPALRLARRGWPGRSARERDVALLHRIDVRHELDQPCAQADRAAPG